MDFPEIHTVHQVQQLIGEAADTHTVVLLDFHAPWCGPCKKVVPVLQQLKQQYGNKLVIVKINVDKAEDVLTQHFQVKSVPTFIFVKNNQVVGVHSTGDGAALTTKCAQILTC